MKDKMTGEMHFLRAYNYFMLVSTYGGVPIIEDPYTLTDEFQKERSSFEDCINFIVSELDKAAELMPLIQSGVNDGRATKGAAIALKSRDFALCGQ